jgi:hypothetical protein
MGHYGENIDRVSEVLDAYSDEDDTLMNWAASVGFNWQKLRDEAAEVGTIVHAMIECFFLGKKYKTPVPGNLKTRVKYSWQAFERWMVNKTVEPILVEETIVRPELGLGGTFDLLAYVNVILTLLDWKTSSALHARYRIQLAAYALLLELKYPERETPDLFTAVRLDRAMGYPEEASWENLDAEKAFFLKLVDIKRGVRELGLAGWGGPAG